MARLSYLQASDLSPENRDLLARSVNIYRALVHSPEATRSFVQLAKYIRFHSRLDPRLREMAILQVGYVMRSPYEYSHHIRIGREFGVSDLDIRAIADETAGRATDLEPLTKAVLRAAREISLQGNVADATFASLQKGLDDERLVDLVMTISFYTGVVRLLATLQIDVEDDYMQYLKDFPLPPAG